jgi:hypothetical protein
MSKNYFFIGVVATTLLVAVFQPVVAGPFGLEMGMQRSDLPDQGKEITPFKIQVTEVPKKHSYFKSYVLKFGPKRGLCYIKAVGKDIKTDEYGTELKKAFSNMEFKLQGIYGQYKQADILRTDSSSDDADEWMESLKDGERILAAYWDNGKGSAMKGSLASVILAAQGASEEVGYLVIDYKFDNYAQCESEISTLEDDVL